MNAAADCEALDAFYRARREGVLQCFSFKKKDRKSQHLFRKGKGARMAALGSCMEGRLEDAVVWRCAAAADSRSRTTSGLTRGRR
jgi:hypothetical protein